MPSTSFADLPTEVTDLVWTAVMGADVSTVLRLRELPDVTRLSSAIFVNRHFATSIYKYRKPGGPICFSTDILPFLGFSSRTTTEAVIQDGHKDENLSERSDRFKASGMNTAKTLVFPQSSEFCHIAPGVPSYLRAWCKGDLSIFGNLHTIITRPSVCYKPTSEKSPRDNSSCPPDSCVQNEISQLVNDLSVDRGMDVTIHADLDWYRSCFLLPSSCVWHGRMGGDLAPIRGKTSISEERLIDHQFHLHLTDPPSHRSTRIYRDTLSGIIQEQARLMSGKDSSWITRFVLTVWGDKDTVKEYQVVLDSMISGQTPELEIPAGGTFVGEVSSIHEAAERPFGEWYR